MNYEVAPTAKQLRKCIVNYRSVQTKKEPIMRKDSFSISFPLIWVNFVNIILNSVLSCSMYEYV